MKLSTLKMLLIFNQLAFLSTIKGALPDFVLPEIITLKEFAWRLKVGRTTVFKWIKEGRLVDGRDFLRFDRTLRFLWSPDLMERLHDNPAAKKDKEPRSQPKLTGKSSGKKTALDLGYH